MQKQIMLDGQPLNDEQGYFHNTPKQAWNWHNFTRGEKVWTEDCNEILDSFVIYISHDEQTVNLVTEETFWSLAVT